MANEPKTERFARHTVRSISYSIYSYCYLLECAMSRRNGGVEGVLRLSKSQAFAPEP